ncbi:MAG TPA: hypothetical protein VGC84_17275 [Ilumatobacteraceae bacterium]
MMKHVRNRAHAPQLLVVAFAAVLIATTNHADAAPIGKANDAPCNAWHIADGSTFESAATTDATMINPATGNPSTPIFRNCRSNYEFGYLEPPVRAAASHASAIQPFTTSSTSSAPRTFTTWYTERPDAIGLRAMR